MIWKNPDSFDTLQKMGNDLEISGQFQHHPENGKWSGKIWRVVELSKIWEIIQKNLESFETVWKLGSDLENPGS